MNPESAPSDQSSSSSQADGPQTTAQICATEGCGKPATLRCPTCIKKGLEPKYFCSQDCFKGAWPTHKLYHNVSALDVLSATPSDVDEHSQRFAGYLFTGSLRPAKLSPTRTVPPEIPRPDYAEDGIPKEENRYRGGTSITAHTPEEIELIRESCKIARDALDLAAKTVAPGVTTDEIDRVVHELIISRGAYPSPLNYKGFPKSCCTSVNEVICHGIPDARPLEDGDIVNVDISVYYKGFHSDLNETYFVGTPNPRALPLVQATYEALEKAIEIVRPGRMYRDIGNVISKHVTHAGFSVVRTYCGHGVGRLFHTAPNVPHYSRNKAVGVMKEGHIFTIEPMINEGTYKDETWPDDWTSVTKDGKLSAQFEHTLLVTKDGCEVLTARTPNSYRYPWFAQKSKKKKKGNKKK